MARAYWSGQVQISLVSFGINLFKASEAKSQISLREIDRNSGETIHHQNITESQKAVDRSDIVKGFEYRKGQYVLLEPGELEKIRIPSRRTLEIKQFVAIREIDLAYFEKPYFVTPENEAQAGTFNVVRKALAETGKAGLGEIAFGGREHLVALMPAARDAPGMMAYTLRYAAELRDPAPVFAGIKGAKIDSEQLALAKELIQKNSRKFDPSRFQDDYEAALREVIEAKIHHKPLPKEAPRRGKVIALTDALRQSLREKSAKASREKARRKAVAVTKRQTKRGGPVLVASAKHSTSA